MANLFTWQCFGSSLALKAPGSDDLDLEVASSITHAELNVAQGRRGQHLAAHQLTGTQTLDEL